MRYDEDRNHDVMVASAEVEGQPKTSVVIGLCVGHDSLFYRYSEAYVTTLVTKDRVTGNNPAAALYTAGSYYKKKFNL